MPTLTRPSDTSPRPCLTDHQPGFDDTDWTVLLEHWRETGQPLLDWASLRHIQQIRDWYLRLDPARRESVRDRRAALPTVVWPYLCE